MAGNKESNPGVQDTERELTCVMLRTVVTLLKGSILSPSIAHNSSGDAQSIPLIGSKRVNYGDSTKRMLLGH